MINMCIKTSWHDDVMFWMHEDAEAAPGVAKRFVELVQKQINERWGVYFTNGDKLCAFNMKCRPASRLVGCDVFIFWSRYRLLSPLGTWSCA